MTHVPPSPHPAPAGRSGLGVPCVLVALLTASAEACKSPDEFRADADREVYEIIKERREELAAGGAFTIDPPTDTLRDRLLEGEAGPQIFDLIACLDVAAENSRDYQTEREILYLTSLDLTLEQPQQCRRSAAKPALTGWCADPMRAHRLHPVRLTVPASAMQSVINRSEGISYFSPAVLIRSFDEC